MEVQVMYLYNHNYEEINTILLSLGSDLNYFYGLVMRIVLLPRRLELWQRRCKKNKACKYLEGNHEMENITWNKIMSDL